MVVPVCQSYALLSRLWRSSGCAIQPLRVRRHSTFSMACSLCSLYSLCSLCRSWLHQLGRQQGRVFFIAESGMIVHDNSSEFGSKLLKTICSSMSTTSKSSKTITSPCTTRATKLVSTYIKYGQRCTQAALAFRSQHHLLWEAIAWEPANRHLRRLTPKNRATFERQSSLASSSSEPQPRLDPVCCSIAGAGNCQVPTWFYCHSAKISYACANFTTRIRSQWRARLSQL
jgi:hypothetical protein